MKKIYEAYGKEKKELIELYNDLSAYEKAQDKRNMGIDDMVLVGRIECFPTDYHVDINWSINALSKQETGKDDIIVLEPLEEQIENEALTKISAMNTIFDKPIKLSKKSIILIPINKYNELIKDKKIKKLLNKKNIRLYEGDEDMAFKMLLFDKYYIFLELSENGYLNDEKNHMDRIGYTKELEKIQEELLEKKQEYINKMDFFIFTKRERKKIKDIQKLKDLVEEKEKNYRIISGLTDETEGELNLDDEIYATIDIGKRRENQEDAVLLMKDKDIPGFKMMVVADGMGGWLFGEVASDVIVKKFKEWFEGFCYEDKKKYYNNIKEIEESLSDEIHFKIQPAVESKTGHSGGSTLVCAIIGKNETLITNVGDSRAYYIKDGRLEQLSREDTEAQRNLEKGKTPSKEASRFDMDSNQLTQCIGMDRRDLHFPYVQIIKNNNYDMLLLFSDGVTDCLSDDDIAVVCKNSNRKEVSKILVEKAIRHDSLEPEEFIDYSNLNSLIPGGKDNTTAAVYVPKEIEDR